MTERKRKTKPKRFSSWQHLSKQTISQEYSTLMAQMHSDKANFGGDIKSLRVVDRLIAKYKIKSIIDYGCGKGALVFSIRKKYPKIEVFGFDPGNPDFSILPTKKYQMIVTSDVMEHIEPIFLNNVLKHINSLFTNIGYFYIATSPSKKKLANGKNAHLIVEGPDYWREKLEKQINGKIIWEDIVERSFTSSGNFREIKLFGGYKMKKNRTFQANKYYALIKK